MRFPSMVRRLRNTQGGTRSTAASPTPYTDTPYPYSPETPTVQPNKLKIVLKRLTMGQLQRTRQQG